MSIASNVILENTRLGTTRTKLRNKLTEYNIWWDNSLTIFELAERLTMMFGIPVLNKEQSNKVYPGGVQYSVTLEDADVPVDWWINGVHSVIRTDSNGVSAITVEYAKGTTGTVVCKVGRKTQIDVNYTCVAFASFDDYAWDYNPDNYDIVKYPSNISHTFNYAYVSNYDVYNLTKAVGGGYVVMAIPHIYANGIDGTNGIHMEVALIQKKDSNSGWADTIALVNSKSLSHYRDTKILELGAYPSKKRTEIFNI